MILVTGAAGKTGRAVIRALIARGESLRAFVRRPEQVPAVEALGAGDVMVGDLLDRASIVNALDGVRAIYLICPNMSPDEVSIAKDSIDAARSAGVERLVYHSVLHPQTEAMPHHWQKLRVEELLIESGLPFTILQPTAYNQNILAHWDTILRQGIYPVPYSVESQSSLVDLGDVAQVAAEVIASQRHIAATYELVGTHAISPREIAGILSLAIERSVEAKQVSLDDWQHNARAAGLGDYQVGTLVKMFRYYDRHDFIGNSNILRWLLGRPPASFTDFVNSIAEYEV